MGALYELIEYIFYIIVLHIKFLYTFLASNLFTVRMCLYVSLLVLIAFLCKAMIIFMQVRIYGPRRSGDITSFSMYYKIERRA